jgi:hypothetical protein
MNLANPAALLWLALALPVVIFYILKIRLRRMPVSTILFWRQIFEEKQPRSIWQHLRHLLSLLLQLAFLGLLGFALAEPFFQWEVLEARRLVLVIDNSASMNATDATPSRLAKAKQEGSRIIAGLRFRDEMAIVAAGTQPQVVCGLTGHERTLQDSLDAVAPTDGPTRVAEAVTLARRLIAEQPNGKVIVLTDGCFDGADKLAEAEDVQLVAVGERTGNVAITRFQVRRSFINPGDYQILAEIINLSDEAVEPRLVIDLNGQDVEVVPLKLAAGAEWSQTFDKSSLDGGRLRASLKQSDNRTDWSDALAADNEAWALLPRRDFQSVTLVTDGNVFLEKVFEANQLVKLTVAKTGPLGAGLGHITVFHRKVPDKLPSGHVLVIDPAGSTDLWQLGDKLQNPIVTKQDKDSPLMTHVKLDNVLMPEARKLTWLGGSRALSGGPKVLAGALTGDPLYAAIERPEGTVLVLTVNLEQGDLPLRTAFPIMVTNALAWFAGNKGELRESLPAGAITEVELPQQPGLRLWPPRGPARPLPAGVTKTTVGPLDKCGIWRIAADRQSARKEPTQPTADSRQPTAVHEIACNLASRSESDLRPPVELQAKAEARLTTGFGTRPIAWYLIAAAWLLVATEWYLYQRRWIS